jgi:hypothetical protein
MARKKTIWLMGGLGNILYQGFIGEIIKDKIIDKLSNSVTFFNPRMNLKLYIYRK